MSEGTPGQPGGIRLENLQIVARPRQHWEALDLGVLIARRWYPVLLASWLCLAGPVFVGVWIVLPEHPILAMMIVWWLKPLYERIPLRILSTSIFGSTPTLREALGGWRAAIGPGIGPALTYRRLSPARSFEAPVWVLEGLDGPARGKRFTILQARAGSGAFWLTVLGVHVEAFLVLGLVTGVYLFIPAGVEVDWWGLLVSGSEGQQDWLVNVLYLLAMAVIAPVYVSSGFALYLNRRVELEAWDIELGFRRLAQRASTAMLLVTFTGLLISSPGSRAEGYPEDPGWEGPEPAMEVLSPRRQASRDAVYEVLAEADFNQQRIVRYPKFLQDLFEPDDAPPPDADDMTWLAGAFRLVAAFAEVLLWAGVVVLVLWLVYRSRLLDLVGAMPRTRPRQGPGEILGLAVGEESLPADVVGAAMTQWRRGEQREALSLIYRASLSALIERHQCDLKAADTEGECLIKAGEVLTRPGLGYLQTLTRAWQSAAYAHTLPADAQFAELCDAWSSTFNREDADEP